MRVLVLCVATFAAGLLAGSLFESDAPSRGARSREDAGSPTEYRVSAEREERAGASGTFDRPGGPAGGSDDLPGDIRGITAEARRAIESYTADDRGAVLREADGKVIGVVRDTKGQAVSGVVLTAIPESRPFELTARWREARLRGHENYDLGEVAQSAIQNELWRRQARRTATTDANGRFEIHGLTDVRHQITAYHEQYEVEPRDRRNRVQPDTSMEFVARPIVLVKIEVRLEDDESADHAWISWEGPDGRGGAPWLKDAASLRLPLGSLELKATISTPEEMESEPVSAVIEETPRREPVVLRLKGRRILTARLVMPDGFAVPEPVEYRMRRVESASVDPESLLQDQSQRLARTPAPGRAQWTDLEPGQYLVAAFFERRRLLAYATAEVGDGPAEVDLPVEEPEPGTYVKAKLLGPDGGPVPGNVSFRVLTGPENQRRTDRVHAMRGPEEWIVFIDKVDTKNGTNALMRVGTRDFGGAIEPFDLRGGGSVVFRFDKPARLNVQVDRYSGSGVEGSLFVALRGELGADAWRQVSPDGSCDMGSVQPGDYQLMLVVRRRGKNYPILQRAVRLRAGDDDMSVTVPALYTLNVRYGGKGKPRNVVLRSKDDAIGGMRLDEPLRGRKASFEMLAAGTYEVECERKRTTVRVPGPPEVVLP